MESRGPEGSDPEANRIVRIGYDRLAALVRLSWVTVKPTFAVLRRNSPLMWSPPRIPLTGKGSNTVSIPTRRYGRAVNPQGCFGLEGRAG